MKHNLFSFLFLISVNLFYYAPNTTASPIIHGQPADHPLWKFHVSIHKRNDPQHMYKHACGGSIISEKHILTAAHCFVTYTDNLVIQEFFYPCGRAKIIAGTNQRDGPGIERDIIKVFIPTGSNRRLLTADLAVAELSAYLGVRQRPMTLAIVPLEVLNPATNAGINQRAMFCGFGYDILLRRRNGRFSPASSRNTINRFMTVRIVDRNECGPAFANAICVKNADTSDIFRTACLGDSGAGLIHRNTIVGVLSQGSDNCDTPDPMKFTSLFGNRRFVEEAMNPNGHRNDMHVLENPDGSRCTIS